MFALSEIGRAFKERVPYAVFKNLLYLNLLIILTLLFSTLGLNYFLRPKALPAISGKDRREEIESAGFLAGWKMDTNLARKLIYQGIPILKRRNNP